jgi:hypothetical protein
LLQEKSLMFRSITLLSSLALPLASGCVTPADSTASSEDLVSVDVPVYLNHTYGMMSAATITALQTNTYLSSQFVDVELRTTVRPDLTYTGTYLNTRETYLEMFPEGTFGFPIGVSGLGLGDEVAGGVQAVHDKWATAFGAAQVDDVTLTSRQINGALVPWFNQTGPKWADISDFTGVWAMEYVPDAGSTAPRTRHTERAARYDAAKLARNIQALIYGLPDGDRANQITTLKAVGWTVTSFGTEFVAVSPLDNGTRRVILATAASPGRIGLLAVIWRLNRATAPHTEQLGDAVLDVAPHGVPYASLWFVPPVPSDETRALSIAQ